jgi:lipoate-protein ligase B
LTHYAACGRQIAARHPLSRKWVSFHGLSINVEPDGHFSGIVLLR